MQQKWLEAANNTNARACLISGPPGIGKTSMVQIMADTLGMEALFVNASDNRSRTMIDKILKEMCDSTSMENFFVHNDSSRKKIIVMDEVDGISGGMSDRGGIAALLKVIKNSKMPVVCIANDHGSKKISILL